MVWAVAVTFATLPNYKDVRENGLDTVELQSKATDLTAMAKETLNYEKDTSLSVKLENLNAAHEQGLLTQVEYEEMKVKLLEDFVTEE